MVKRITPLTRKQSEIYSDFHKDLVLSPVSNDLAKKIDEESVKESIKNLILTDRFERPFQPFLGGNIRSLLFSNFVPGTIETVDAAIRSTLIAYEPRCEIVNIEIEPNPDLNAFRITIVFSIINSEKDTTLQVTLKRVR